MDFEKSLEILKGSNKSETGLRKVEQFLSETAGKIKKVKYKPNDRVIRLYDYEVRLPFHPLYPDAEGYSLENPYISPLSEYNTVKSLKHAARESKTIYNHISAKISAKDWDVSSVEPNEADRLLFRKYHSPRHFSANIQKFKFSSFGTYGRCFLSLAKMENGIALETDIGYEIYEIESAITKARVEELKLTFEKGGINAKLSDSEKASKVTAMWGTCLVSPPYMKGVARCIEFPSVKDDEFTEEVYKDLDSYTSGGDSLPIAAGARYFSCCATELTKIQDWISSSKYDTRYNYFLTTLCYTLPEKSVGKDNEMIDAYQGRSFNSNPIINKIPASFEEQVDLYMNNYESHYSEKLMLRSVNEFSICNGSLLLELYKNELLASDKLKYIDEHCFKFHKDLLSQMGEEVISAITENILDGAAPEHKQITDEEMNMLMPEDEGEVGDIVEISNLVDIEVVEVEDDIIEE